MIKDVNNWRLFVFLQQIVYICTKIRYMEKVLAENVKRICKAQNRQLKELASDMGIDPASLTRAIYGNARLDTIEKIAMALGVSVKSLFEPMGDEAVEGYIKMGGKIYQFNSREELRAILKE